MLDNTTDVTVDNVIDHTQRALQAGARLLTATGLDEGDHFEVIYHFDTRGGVSHLRLSVPKDVEVPSISGIFPGAFLIENEMKELLGVNITGISVDYGGHLFMIEGGLTLPMARSTNSVTGPEVTK